MKKQPELQDAPHEAIANEMFRKFGHRVRIDVQVYTKLYTEILSNL